MITLRMFDTPIKIKLTALIDIAILWAGLTLLGLYLHPERGLWQDALIGFVTVIVLLPADFGHALAHTFSARYAGAPMDEILITPGMPRTLYRNNEVPPEVHRMRALGGPIFNVMGFLLSAGIFGLAPAGSLVRELAAWSALGHGLLLILSLAPVPLVDGGTILKWTLVAKGRAEAEADEIVRRIDWVIAIVAGVVGVGLVVVQQYIAGMILAGISVLVIAIAAGKIR